MDADLVVQDNDNEELNAPQTVAYNLGDLKKEEEILLSLCSKMKDQLHKLEVEELELKQKIRRKELNEATADLFSLPPPVPLAEPVQRKRRSTKAKSARRRKQERTSSMSHDETASEVDDSMSVTSAITNPSPVSVRSVKSTPTRKTKSTKDSPSKLSAARALAIPSIEPEKLTLELDLSALNSLSLPKEFNQSTANFVESEDEH